MFSRTLHILRKSENYGDSCDSHFAHVLSVGRSSSVE